MPDADELEWYVPAAILPEELQRSLNVINQILENPLDLGGKKASQLLTKKSSRRRRRRSPSVEGDAQLSDSDGEVHKKRKERKKKEKEVYKSAQFIEDSDVEYSIDDEAFWKKEKALREKTALLAAEGKSTTMRETGTKKRKKRRTDREEDEDEDEGNTGTKSRKKLKTRVKKSARRDSDAEDSDSEAVRSDLSVTSLSDEHSEDVEDEGRDRAVRKAKRVVFSDEEG